MKAVRKIRPECYGTEIVDIPEPIPAPDQVKIKVKYCGICGSDMKFYHWNMRAGMNIDVPFTFGHEYCGIVTEVGSNVPNDIKVGDRVVSETCIYSCGKCEQCAKGNYLLCNNKRSIGYQADGAMAEYVVMRYQMIHHIPDNVSFEEAALTEPCAVTARAVYDLVDIMPGDIVVIYGPGAIGLLTLAHVKALNATAVVVGMEKDRKRLEVAEEIGADYILASDKCDILEEIKKITSGRGADVCFECTGAGPVLRTLPLLVKKQGTVCVIALFKPGDIAIDTWNIIVNNEITIRGSYGSRYWGWEKCLNLFSQKKINIRPVVTDIFKINDWKKAFDKAEAQEGLKILIEP